ncbi:cytokinin dehydrogenase 4-like [Prunus yedoensis var. nudiflora]|uniref:Cytokinin dehydrogenase 4-like n=1 Tax=Prunus yedoensis var. nudiflora TaxID=2094558 RepID=A0A314ZJJ1_PRUYE|nr:cytokinin dehydrogenase 4-like [Prunus yedoensis var. nudiflora]
MAENFAVPKSLTTVTFFIGFMMLSTTGTSLVLFPPKDIAGMLRNDTESINSTSTDYGHIVREFPAAVFNPTSPNDIASLILFSNNNSDDLLSSPPEARGILFADRTWPLKVLS